VPSAFAQGYGFNTTLSPVRGLWRASRNAAFALSSLVIIVLAFMVMFRTKVSPQTVISVQSALPKIVISLLLITFSYAISGFIIDLGFLLLGMVGALASFSELSNASAISIFGQLNQGVGSVMAYGAAFIFESVVAGQGGVLNRLSGASQLNIGALFGYLDIIIAFIILLLLIIALVRIFWLLLRSYTIFVFTVIASPFIILLGTLRPASGGAGAWIKILVSQVAVFISVSMLILLGHIFFWSFGNGSTPLIGGVGLLSDIGPLNPFGIKALAGLSNDAGSFPGGFSFSNTAAIGFFVSLAVMLSIPKIASSIRDYIQTGRATFGLGLGDAGLGEYAKRYSLIDRDQTGLQNALEEGGIRGGAKYFGASAGQRLTDMISRRK